MIEQKIQKVAEAPSIALEKGLEWIGKIGKGPVDMATLHKAQVYWNNLGPGLITGAADDDPSGIATYSQAGAQYGTQLLWLAWFTFPLMSIVQEMCARIGLMTGRGLAGNIRINYPKKVLYAVTISLFVANTLNLGADIGAMSKAVQLLNPSLNFVFLTIGFTVFSILLQIFTSYGQYAKYLKWLVLVLFSYIASALLVRFDYIDVFRHAIIPTITVSKDQILLITAILGTTISPYLFFWQTSQEIEEEILHGKTTIRLRQGTTKKEIRRMRTDVWSGMLVSNVVMFFIILACAVTLFPHGINNINSAADAASALKPIAGQASYFLFAIGIIGAGLLAVPVLAGSVAYSASETFGWRNGLYRKLKEARAFYGVIIISMGFGLLINFIGIDPIKLLIFSAVVNGLVAPLILFLLVQMTSRKRVMKDWVNKPLTTLMGWFIVGIMVVSGVATILSLFI